MQLKSLPWLAAVCLWGVTFASADDRAPRLAPDLPYQAERRNPVSYQVDFRIVVTPPYKTKQLRVWVPIPPSDVGQAVSGSQWETFPLPVVPQTAAEPEFGNRFAYFEFSSPQGAQIIRHQFQIQVWELHWKLDPARVTATAEWPAEFDVYRRGEAQAIVVDDRFRQLMSEIVPQRQSPLKDFERVMNWVEERFEYDHTDASLRANSEHGLLKRHGHCSDYHSFCAALGRAMGMPTRVTYGINTFPKNSPSHCKLEAFLPPYGWVSFDVSETQRLIRDIEKSLQLSAEERLHWSQLARERLASGFRDNTWFVQTRGTDYHLAPPTTRRIPVVRTAYMEADGKPLREPDPADKDQSGFSWMTAHEYRPDRPITYAFADWKSLESR